MPMFLGRATQARESLFVTAPFWIRISTCVITVLGAHERHNNLPPSALLSFLLRSYRARARGRPRPKRKFAFGENLGTESLRCKRRFRSTEPSANASVAADASYNRLRHGCGEGDRPIWPQKERKKKCTQMRKEHGAACDVFSPRFCEFGFIRLFCCLC